MLKRYFSKTNLCWIALAAVVFTVVTVLINAGLLGSYYQITLYNICINIILAVSLNLIIGICGQFSLGHAGFMCIGAYSAAIMVKSMPNMGGFAIGIVIGLIISAIAALIVSIPTLRLRGDYLAIATLGFAEIMRAIIQWKQVGPLTNASNLLKKFANFDSVLFPFIISAICIGIIVLIINSTYGRAFKAIRDDEIAAEAMGINLAKHKMQAFLISSFFAGVGGALLAMFQSSVQANTFTSTMTYEILLIVVIGGIGSVTGSILGSFLYIACSEWWLRFLDDPMPYIGVSVPFMRGGFRMLVFSVVIMIVVLFFRKGIMGDREFSWDGIINFFGKLFKKKDKPAKEVASK